MKNIEIVINSKPNKIESTINITNRVPIEISMTKPGLRGLSAYQIWLLEGNEGTAEDFLNSLQTVVWKKIDW